MKLKYVIYNLFPAFYFNEQDFSGRSQLRNHESEVQLIDALLPLEFSCINTSSVEREVFHATSLVIMSSSSYSFNALCELNEA